VRCYLMRDGHIGAVELVSDASDEAALAEAKALFAKRNDVFSGFEIWDRARFVHRHPPLPPKYTRGTGSEGRERGR
jgi:hypothetical protein